MFHIHQAWFLSLMLANMGHDYNVPNDVPRFRPELSEWLLPAGDYHRTMSDCLIAAQKEEEWYKRLYARSEPVVAVKCDHTNPWVNSPNRPTSIEAINKLKEAL